MKLEDIKIIARQHNVKTGKTRKSELIRAIQQAENNDICFESGTAHSCGQDNCLWRADCSK